VAYYEYDGAGNRIAKTVNSVKTKYINDLALGLVQVIMETTDANTVQATYTYGNDLISLTTYGLSLMTSFYHYDGLGTTRQLTNSAGGVTVAYTYDSFGNLIASSGTVANSYGFTGESQFNEADNLVFLRARYYQPSYGRFISRDPIGYYDSMNLYQYCGNNSINFADPLGLSFTSCWSDCFKKMLGGDLVDMCATGIGAIGLYKQLEKVKFGAIGALGELSIILAEMYGAWAIGSGVGCALTCMVIEAPPIDYPPSLYIWD
jgi:RHS repeat-associated protein